MSVSAVLGERRIAATPAGTIEYRESGRGSPVVFVHGVGVNGDLWRRVAPRLAAEHRCIVPDLPWGAHSRPLRPDADLSLPGMARIVADFMAALELDDVTLVGNDSGGALSQLVVTRHPERVGRLVLTPCDAFDNFPPKMFRYLSWAAKVPGAMAPIVQSMRLRANRRTPIAFGWLTKRRLPNAVSDHYVNPVIHDRRIREDARAFILGLDPADTLAAAEKLSGFDRPVLLAWAPEDRFFPIAHAERLAELLPDARLARIEDSRTFVSEDQPQRLAELIAGFVREPAKAAAG